MAAQKPTFPALAAAAAAGLALIAAPAAAGTKIPKPMTLSAAPKPIAPCPGMAKPGKPAAGWTEKAAGASKPTAAASCTPVEASRKQKLETLAGSKLALPDRCDDHGFAAANPAACPRTQILKVEAEH